MDFYNQTCLHLGKALLGQLLVHKINGERISGYITEVECYPGNDDIASHSYNGKRTLRNEPMYMKAGTVYVYSIYGMYFCFNISAKEEGSAVLIRSLEPCEGLEQMKMNRERNSKSKSPKTNFKLQQFCGGPSKLCQALDITKDSCNKLDLCESNSLWIEDGHSLAEEDIVLCKRIGIESAGEEWANKPLRFYWLNNTFVSVRDKRAEEGKRQAVT